MGPMSTERFELEGQVYYQQGRRCGKPHCHCAEGELHGPYWYRRDSGTGKVAYLGRQLPSEVQAARAARDRMWVEVRMVLDAQRKRADALARLLESQPLSARDREVIQDLGFGSCLVEEESGDPQAPAKENEAEALMESRPYQNAAFIQGLARGIEQSLTGVRTTRQLLKRVLREQMWRSQRLPQTGELVTFQYFAEFAVARPPRGLGASVDDLIKLYYDDPEITRMLGEAVSQGPPEEQAQQR